MTFKDKAKAHAKDLAAKVGDQANKVRSSPLAEKAKPLAEKAGPLAERAGQLAAKGVSAAASSMDRATHGKYHDKIEHVSGKLGEVLNRDGHTGRDDHDRPGPDQPRA